MPTGVGVGVIVGCGVGVIPTGVGVGVIPTGVGVIPTGVGVGVSRGPTVTTGPGGLEPPPLQPAMKAGRTTQMANAATGRRTEPQ